MRYISRVSLPSIKYPLVESKLAQHASYATLVECPQDNRPKPFPRHPGALNKESYQSRFSNHDLANEVLKRIRLRYQPLTQDKKVEVPEKKAEVHFSINEYESKPTFQSYTGTAEIIEADTRKPPKKRDLNSYAARASNISLSSTYNPQRGNRATYHTDRNTRSEMSRSCFKYKDGYIEPLEKYIEPSPTASFECPKEPYITRLSQLLGSRGGAKPTIASGREAQSVPPSFGESTKSQGTLPKTYVEEIPSVTSSRNVVKLGYNKRKLDDLGRPRVIPARIFPPLESSPPKPKITEDQNSLLSPPKHTKQEENSAKSDDISSSTFEGTAVPGPKRTSPDVLQASAMRQLENVKQKNLVLRMQRNEQSKRVQNRINTMLQDTKIKLMNKKREADRFRKGVVHEPKLYPKSSLGVRASHLPLEACPRAVKQTKYVSRKHVN